MSLNWIKVEEYSFNSFLLMERFQLRFLLKMVKQDDTDLNMPAKAHGTVR